MGRPKGSKNKIQKGTHKIPKALKVTALAARKHLENFQREIDENNPPHFEDHILNAYRSKSYELCIELIDYILEDSSGAENNHYKILQAAAYTMLGQEIHFSHQLLDQVISSDPSNSCAFFGKGFAFYQQKRFDESLEMLNKALDLNPDLETHRVNDVKMRIDLERRKAVIMINKVDEDYCLKFSQPKNDFEIPEGFGQFVEDFKGIEDIVMDEIESGKLKLDEMIFEELDEINADEWKTETIAEAYQPDEQESKEKLQKTLPDIPESLPKSFQPSTAEDFFAKGYELYLSSSLKKAQKMFAKSLKLEPTLRKAELMGEKSQELQELLDVNARKLEEKNFEEVVGTASKALAVDEKNDYVNRLFHYQRGLAYYYLGDNEASLKDYTKYEHFNFILSN